MREKVLAHPHGFDLSLLPLSCSKANSANAVSTDFLKKLYTVDKSELSAMQDGFSQANNLTSDPDALNKMNNSAESLHTKFKADMTDSSYKNMLSNRTYLTYLMKAENKNCTFQCTDLSLTQGTKSDTAVQYNYTATVKITYMDGQSQDNFTESGVIQATKDTQWKVSYINVSKHADFIYES